MYDLLFVSKWVIQIHRRKQHISKRLQVSYKANVEKWAPSYLLCNIKSNATTYSQDIIPELNPATQHFSFKKNTKDFPNRPFFISFLC